MSDISCPSVRLCVVGDGDGDIFTYRHPARHAWTRTRLRAGSGGFDARRLSCPSSKLCVSVSSAGIASSTRPAAGAKAWTVSMLPTDLYGLAAVGCARSLCVAGDWGDNLMVSSSPAAGASAWARFNLGQGYNGFESISCPSADLCVAGDNDGNIATSTNPIGGAGGWNVEPWPVDPAGASSTAGGAASELSSLSCPSQNLCAGVSRASLMTPTDPAGGSAAWSVATLSHVSPLTVSCPSLNLCVAGSFEGAILTSTAPTGGAAWSSTQLGATPLCGKYSCGADPIAAVSCASEHLCAATDGQNLWISTNPGSPSASWTKSQLPHSQLSPSLRLLTCPAENLCVSVIGEELDTTSDPSDPSPTWTVTHLPSVTGAGDLGPRTPGVVSGVSCPSSQLCVAVDEVAGYAFTGNPTDPNSWAARKIDTPLVGSFVRGPRALTEVSCSPSGLCVAVDAEGKVIVGRVSG